MKELRQCTPIYPISLPSLRLNPELPSLIRSRTGLTFNAKSRAFSAADTEI